MVDSNIYLGRPGNLASIYHPKGIFGATRERQVYQFALGNGGTRVDQMIGGARRYSIGYEGLTREAFGTLQAFADGHEGPGPFALLDPGQRNMLPSNVSAATSITNDTTTAGSVGNFAILGPYDTFNRTAATSGWGTSTSGQAWTVEGVSAQYSTDGTVGRHIVSALNTVYRSRFTSFTAANVGVRCRSLVAVAAAGSYIRHELTLRFVDTSNYYAFRAHVQTSGAIDLQLVRLSAAVETVLTTLTSAVTHTGGVSLWFDFQAVGTTLQAKIWRDDAVEPDAWEITTTDATHTTGSVGVATLLPPGNTNVRPFTVQYDEFEVTTLDVTVASSTAYTDAGPRVLAWTFGSPASSDLTVVWPSSTFAYGIPVVVGRAICFSCWVRGGGTDAIVTYTPRIVWRTEAGAEVSATSGSNVASASGAWAQMFATGTPPATAVYADVDIRYASGATAGSIGYFRRFMVNEGSTPDTTWMPGTGVWPVKITDLTEAWHGRFPELRDSPVITFQEDTS